MTSTRVCMRAHMQAQVRAHTCAHTRGRGRKRKRRAIHLGMDSWAISQQFLFGFGVMPGPLKTSSKEPSSTFMFSASPIHLFFFFCALQWGRSQGDTNLHWHPCSLGQLSAPEQGLENPSLRPIQLVSLHHCSSSWWMLIMKPDVCRYLRNQCIQTLTSEDRSSWQLLSYTVRSHSGVNSSLPEYRRWRAQHQGQINTQCIVEK